MELRQLQLNDNLLRAMYNLRLQIEIAEHRRFHVTQTVDDLAELLAAASHSHHPLVRSAYQKFVRLLDEGQLRTYTTLGLPVRPENDVSDQVNAKGRD